MKAIIYERYGTPDVLQLKEIEKPVPAQDEVLVKVHAASVNAYDWHFLTADVFLIRLGSGFLKPKITRLGADLSGTVESVGSSVTQFKPGDEVYGTGVGAFAEYACVREKALALKPASLTFEEAAAVPMAALTALQGLRDHGHIQPGQKILINGASGGVGTYAVQFARYFGAEVTAVTSTSNLDAARSLGADNVIDYTREDFTKNGRHYDLILAANGYHSIFAYERALTSQGIFVIAGGRMAQLAQVIVLGPWRSKAGGRRFGTFVAKLNRKDLDFITELVESGKIKPVIDRRFNLTEVPDALRYLGTGHARGKVVINIG